MPSPIRSIPYRIPLVWREKLREEIRELLDQDIIQPSTSSWGSPVVTVKKKDGSLRMCVDYRKLNKVTVEDPYQMPRIDELIDRQEGAKYLTTLDLTKGYYQVPVCKQDQEKTAFVTLYGKYEFKTIPFRLKGAPTTFQRLMDITLTDMSEFAAAYLDDVVIFSDTWT